MDAGTHRQTVLPSTVRLADGRTVVVRDADPADVPGLLALFGRLTPDDRYRRFFSGFRPDDDFVRALVTRAPTEGRLLVAEVTGPAGSEIVAEAEFARLPDGDGELAVTVDRDWRGWLGPFLLDVLLQVADAADIPNLRAEVLAQNRPMLALLRARGAAVAESGDPCVTAVVIGAHGAAPSWAPGSAHPRVLLEAAGGRWQLTKKLGEAGVPVLRCPGPAARPANVPCPLLEGGRCPLADGADVIVHALGRDDPRSAAVLDAHRGTGRHVVEVDPTGADDVDDLVAEIVDGPERRPDGG
jgi:hypothetical protein